MNKRYIDFVPAKRKPVNNRDGASLVQNTGNAHRNVNGATSGVAPGIKVKRPALKKVEKTWSDEDDYLGDVPVSQMFAEKAPPAGVSTGYFRVKKQEDIHPKFVKTEVKKRPLSARKAPTIPPPTSSQMATKASKTPVKPLVRPTRPGMAVSTVRRPGAAPFEAAPASVRPMKAAPASVRPMKAAPASVRPTKAAPQGMAKLQPTKAKFLNTNKIVKRPLSKTAYQGRLQPALSTSNKTTEAEKPAKKSGKPSIIIAKPEKDSKAGLIVAIIITIILGAAAGTVAFLLLPK